MPIDNEGNTLATDVCQTSYEYSASSTQLATTTKYCYREKDVYFNFGIELLFIIATIGICFTAARIFKKQNPNLITIYNKK